MIFCPNCWHKRYIYRYIQCYESNAIMRLDRELHKHAHRHTHTTTRTINFPWPWPMFSSYFTFDAFISLCLRALLWYIEVYLFRLPCVLLYIGFCEWYSFFFSTGFILNYFTNMCILYITGWLLLFYLCFIAFRYFLNFQTSEKFYLKKLTWIISISLDAHQRKTTSLTISNLQ